MYNICIDKNNSFMIVSKYHKTPRSLSFISFHSIVEPMMMEQHKYLQRKQEIKLLS